MTLGLNKIMALFDPSAVFILGAYFKLQSFLIMPVAGLTNGLTPLVAYNYGAGLRERIQALVRFALALGAAIMAAGTLLLCLFPGFFLRLFDADPQVLSTGVTALRIIASSFVFAGVSTVLCAVFQALGASLLSLAVSLLRQVVLMLPLALVLGLLQPALMWACFPAVETVTCLLALLAYRRLCRRKLLTAGG